MSDQFYKAARGRPWSEQGCIERLITIFFILLIAALCLGGVAVLLSVLSS